MMNRYKFKKKSYYLTHPLNHKLKIRHKIKIHMNLVKTTQQANKYYKN